MVIRWAIYGWTKVGGGHRPLLPLHRCRCCTAHLYLKIILKIVLKSFEIGKNKFISKWAQMDVIGPHQNVRGYIAATRGAPTSRRRRTNDDDEFFLICLLTVLVCHILFAYMLLVDIYSHHSLWFFYRLAKCLWLKKITHLFMST